MQSNITNQQFWSSDSPLAEPHFDQEATVLSARPVVPIAKLTEKKPGFSGPWVFGFALAGALLLGMSATAVYYSQFRAVESQAAPALNIDSVSAGAEGLASGAVALDEPPKRAADAIRPESSSVEPETPVRVKAITPSPSWTTKPLNSSNAVSKKPVGRRATVVAGEASEIDSETRERRGGKRVVVDEDSQPEDETWGERRLRREAKEQRRANRERRGRQRSDDLLRIREIFEGSPRP